MDSIPGVSEHNRLLFIGDQLVILTGGNVRELLFHTMHNTMGHFGFEKGYESLRNSYYWPNMQKELADTYIPSCVECQKNKS